MGKRKIDQKRQVEVTEAFSPKIWYDNECKEIKKRRDQALKDGGKSSLEFRKLYALHKKICKRKKKGIFRAAVNFSGFN